MPAIDITAYHSGLFPRFYKCYWCGKKRPCYCENPGFEPTLYKLDLAWLCKECRVRECPPHKLFVHKFLGQFLNEETNMTHLITTFAYPVSLEPFRSHCFNCDPKMQRYHRCRVCQRLWRREQVPHPYQIDPTLKLLKLQRWNYRGQPFEYGWDWHLGRWNVGASWAGFGGGGWASGGGGWASGGGGWANGWDLPHGENRRHGNGDAWRHWLRAKRIGEKWREIARNREKFREIQINGVLWCRPVAN